MTYCLFGRIGFHALLSRPFFTRLSPLNPPPPPSFSSYPFNLRFLIALLEHRAFEQIKEGAAPVSLPGRRASSAPSGAPAMGLKTRRSFEGVLSSAGVDRRPTSADANGAVSAPQPRPHSDLIPGVTDDRYVAAWRKRGPVTLLNVGLASGHATPTSGGADSSTEPPSSEDEGHASVKRRISSKPSNPQLQQTIQEVLSESSNDSTDEFLAAEHRGKTAQQQQQETLPQQRAEEQPQRRDLSAARQPEPSKLPSYSPGQVSIGMRKSDHLQLDESGESETDPRQHHVIPALSV